MIQEARTCPAVAPQRLIEQYEAIADASQQMALAARDDRWEEFERLRRHCERLIAALKAQACDEPLAGAARAQRIALLGRMLAADADIRARTEAWWGKLEGLLRRTPTH